MPHSTSVPYPNKVWYFNILALFFVVLGMKVLVGFNVDFTDTTSLWYFAIAMVGIIGCQIACLTGINVLYEEYNRIPESSQNHGKGIKYLVGFAALGYLLFIMLYALSVEHTDVILYFIEVYNILAFAITMPVIMLIFGYISIYHIWG